MVNSGRLTGGKITFALLGAFLITALFSLLTVQVAAAHGTSEVANGKYQLLFGFKNEPAVAGAANGLELKVCDGKCKSSDGKLQNPVKDVEKNLKAQVIFGAQTLDLTLTPSDEQAGVYTADFVPSRAGDYSFRFYGNIGGANVDEQVSSGKDSFDAVVEAKVFPAGSGYTGQTELEAQLKEAQKNASNATTFANVALAVAIVSVLMGLGALISAGSRGGRSRGSNFNLSREKREKVGAGSDNRAG